MSAAPQSIENYTQNIISGMWSRIASDVVKQWPQISPAECDSVNGDARVLATLLETKFRMTSFEAESTVDDIAVRYDTLLPDYKPDVVHRKAALIWSEIPLKRLQSLDGRRSSIVNAVALYYGLPRRAAWMQVNQILVGMG